MLEALVVKLFWLFFYVVGFRPQVHVKVQDENIPFAKFGQDKLKPKPNSKNTDTIIC